MLSRKQTDAFRRDGYLVVDNGIRPEPKNTVRGEHREAMDRSPEDAGRSDVPGGLPTDARMVAAHVQRRWCRMSEDARARLAPAHNMDICRRQADSPSRA